jgi:hypothetical protein
MASGGEGLLTISIGMMVSPRAWGYRAPQKIQHSPELRYKQDSEPWFEEHWECSQHSI